MLSPIDRNRQDCLRPAISSNEATSTEWKAAARLRLDRTAASKALQARVLSGSLVLLAGTGSVTLMNLIYNVAAARFLGPTGFGHVAAVSTLLVLMSAVMLSFQIVSAKIVAQQQSVPEKIAAYDRFHVGAWACGILACFFLLVFQLPISRYLNLPTSLLVAILGIGAVFYIPLGSRRGYLQGSCHFRHLAVNLAVEGLIKLGASLLFIKLGYGVPGVIAANSASVVLAYVFAAPALRRPAIRPPSITVDFHEGLQALVFFAGVVIINNSDILVVKHYFAGPLAGLYAAIALVGRVVFVLAFSVASSMFPIAAENQQQGRRNHRVLATSLVLVAAMGAAIAVGLRLAPAGIWTALFGSQFGAAGPNAFSQLLSLYAATTGLYCLSVVIILYEMSRKIARIAWIQLAFSVVLIAAMCRYHASLEQVIWVQLLLIIVLLIAVASPFLFSTLVGTPDTRAIAVPNDVRILRRISEEEVIAEFLKTDFCAPDFKPYQSLAGIVIDPDLEDAAENDLRRALFFIRHGALWRELPKDTQWFEVELRKQDLPRLYVFPRAHWRKLAGGNFGLTEVVMHITIESSNNVADEAFRAKIRSLRDLIAQDAELGAVLLIGRNESGPFTILDGNHRLAAGLMLSSDAVENFRVFCGLSPQMTRCCWYETNFATLCRYATNLLRSLAKNPESEVARLLQKS